MTSPGTYNNGQWHMVVAEVGAGGQQLWVDGTMVASNPSITAAESYTGYWHLGWGYESGWVDGPTDGYLTGSLAQTAVIPAQLSSVQISSLDAATTAAVVAVDLTELSPTSFWALDDSASNVCGTTDITIQQVVGSTNTCVYPAAAGSCPAPLSSYLLSGLGGRTFTAPASNTPVTLDITMQLSVSPATAIAGLQMLPYLAFGTALTGTAWSAQLAYPYASVQI